MKDIRSLLEQAYSCSLAKDCKKESEDALSAFEEKYNTIIPQDYRTLLLEFGALHFSEEPHLYSLDDLQWAYPAFIAAYEEDYLPEYSLPQDLAPFPIGCFGDGSTAILDRNSGKVLMLIHDCNEDIPLEDVSESFAHLVERQAQFVIELCKMM